MAIKPISVSQLNDYISRIMNTDPILGNVIVTGEISGINYHSTGHIYLTLMDSYSKINCFIRQDYATTLPIKMENGMTVTLMGYVNLFKKNGTYSLNVKNVEIAGTGILSIAFEKLKADLNKEGLFDKSHKKPIPAFPKKIGIITSKTGAAYQDILRVIRERNNFVDVILFPTLVQGENAAASVANMIGFVNDNFKDIDTLIVGRGGGAAEDLFVFNDERIARAVYNSKIPIISSVGHEIDYTICDMVSDLSALTPTQAAHEAVPDLREIRYNMERHKDQLYSQLLNKFKYNKLVAENIARQMSLSLKNKMNDLEQGLERSKLILLENNPRDILKRGYATIEDSLGNIVTSPKEVKDTDNYKVTFKDGSAVYKMIMIGSEDNDK